MPLLMRQFRGFLFLVAVCGLIGPFAVDGAALAASPRRPTEVDPTFRFGETNIAGVHDIELFSDGTIAYGGVGGFRTVGRADETGNLPPAGGGGGGGLNVLSVDVDDKDVAIFGAGAAQFLSPVQRVVKFGEDSNWAMRNNIGGTVREVIVREPVRDVLVAGQITIPGVTNEFYGMVRLQRTGAIDTGFAYTNFAGLQVTEAAVTADGKILAAFETTNEIFFLRPGFGRWLASGERDTNYDGTWAVTWGTNTHVTVIRKAPGTNGFVAAQETWLAGPEAPKATRLIQLDEEGRPVDWMATEDQINGVVHAIAFEAIRPETVASNSYDRIIIGGEFTHVGETPYNRLAAISKDGTVAWGFASGEGPDAAIQAVEVQLDGKVLIGGAFTNLGTMEVKGMGRLEGNRASGMTHVYWANSEFRAFEKLGRAELVLRRAGNTNEALAVNLEIAPTNAEPRDLNLVPKVVHFGLGQSEIQIPIIVQNDGLREGRERFQFRITGVTPNALVSRAVTELVVLDNETAGTLDPTPVVPAGTRLSNYAVQGDGKVLVVGGTTVTRYNADGTLDETFVTNGIPALPGVWFLQRIVPQPDGKTYVSGRFNTTNTFGINHLARLNADGTLDTTFDPKLSAVTATTPFGSYVVFDLHPDGRVAVLLLGTGITRQLQTTKMFRLSATGALDPGFNPSAAVREAGDLMHLPNGELIFYSDMPGIIQRLRTNGVPDSSFMVNVRTSRGYVYDFKVVEGALWVGGSFKEMNSLAISNLARVNLTNGAVDTTFVAKLDDEVTDIREQDGKVFIAGAFTKVNGVDRFRVARLNLDGSLDSAFDAGLGPNLRPGRIETEADGDVLVGINVVRVDGIETDQLVRLEGNPPFSLGAPPDLEVLWPTNGTEILVSDAVVPLDIRVRLRDVDGDLRDLVVNVDGTDFRTNAVEGEMVVPWPQPADGEHQLQATVTDSGGLTDSETITFRIRTLPFPGSVEARREGNAVVIRYTRGTLQGSTDLRTWTNVHSGGGEFRPTGAEKEQFFRVLF